MPEASARPDVALSVLVPAYDDLAGVMRIVAPLLAEGRSDLEIRIHDDSAGDEIERAIAGMRPLPECLHYVRNAPPAGAVANWNGLLAAARGRYVVLIHHDDYPLSERFAAEVIDELRHAAWPDAMLLTCVAHDPARHRLKTGVGNGLRRGISQRWPVYLLRRNVIGPPSAIVMRRDLVPPYDPALTWLVDVDAYVRFFSAGARRVLVSRQVMVSTTGQVGSITGRIRHERARIAAAELAHIARRTPPYRGSRLLASQSAWARAGMSLEWLIWGGIRLLSALGRGLSGSRVSVLDVERRRARGAAHE